MSFGEENEQKKENLFLILTIAIFIIVVFVFTGMLTGSESTSTELSRKTYRNIVLDNHRDFEGNHYPFVLNSDEVYEPLIRKDTSGDCVVATKFIEEKHKPYAVVKTIAINKSYKSSKNPLINLGRYISRTSDNQSNKPQYQEKVTIYQPVNYNQFVSLK